MRGRLPSFLISFGFIVTLLANFTLASATAVAPVSASSLELLALANNVRQTNGLYNLVIDDRLTAAAEAKAQDMVKHDYWSHVSPTGVAPWYFIDQTGYSYNHAGENLAYGFTDFNQVITGWMNSTEHRKNLLSNDFREVGFGIVEAPNFQSSGPQTVIVAQFGTPTNQPATAPVVAPAVAEVPVAPTAPVEVAPQSQSAPTSKPVVAEPTPQPQTAPKSVTPTAGTAADMSAWTLAAAAFGLTPPWLAARRRAYKNTLSAANPMRYIDY